MIRVLFVVVDFVYGTLAVLGVLFLMGLSEGFVKVLP